MFRPVFFNVLVSFFPSASLLSSSGVGTVCGECVDHLSHQPEEAPPNGGPVVVLRWGRDESVAAALPTGPSQAPLLSLETNYAALPHQHLPSGCAFWGCPGAGGYQRDCALWWSAGLFWATWSTLPFLYRREDISDLPPPHSEAAAGSKSWWTGKERNYISLDFLSAGVWIVRYRVWILSPPPLSRLWCWLSHVPPSPTSLMSWS